MQPSKCWFYGLALVRVSPTEPPLLVSTGNHHCALLTGRASKNCVMEFDNRVPNWAACEWNPAADQPIEFAFDMPLSVAEKAKAAHEWGMRFEGLGRTEKT